MIKLVFLLMFLGQLTPYLSAQNKYWIHSDDTLLLSGKIDIRPNWCSAWIPYCSYSFSEEQIDLLPTELNYKPVASFRINKSIPSNKYGYALEQMEAELLIERGLTGKDVKIGIIDGGFLHANQAPNLMEHFTEKRVKFYQDFITPDMPPYTGSKHLDDAHGSEVWGFIGGKNAETGVISGIALDAEYYLARTDHGAFEKRLEEDLLIEALENFEEKGVRLVNISLGYADGYTRKDQNYNPSQMDGKTTKLTLAVDKAFYEKNMLIIVSAGNEGNRPKWRVLSAPADAQGALSVGASLLNGRKRMKYSSIGTPGIGYIKPEVVCFASNGTSFSAPILTGFAAAIMQYDPSLTASDIKELIIQSASFYPYGNNHLGYGIPKASTLLRLLNGEKIDHSSKMLTAKKDRYKVRIPDDLSTVNIFHKNSENEVLQTYDQHIRRQSFKIKRWKESSQTTVLTMNDHFEIYWEKSKE